MAKMFDGVVLLLVVVLCCASAITTRTRIGTYSLGPSSHAYLEQTFNYRDYESYRQPQEESNHAKDYVDLLAWLAAKRREDRLQLGYSSLQNLADAGLEYESPQLSHSYQKIVTHHSTSRGNTPDFRAQEEKMKYLCLVLGICSNFAFGMPNGNTNQRPGLLAPVFEWKQMEFQYDSEAAKKNDIASGFYVPSVPTPIDVDVSYSGNGSKVFVTIPRFQVGSPMTLGFVNSKNLVEAFPSWSWHRNPESCLHDRLISVYRVKIDECGRMWVLDTGRYGDHQTCEPQIIAFDPITKAVLHRFTIPKNLLEGRSVLVTPIIDNRDKQCRDTFVYVADCQTYSIIVYDVKHEKAWKATDKTMYPYPNFGTYTIQGDSFDLMDGVLGMDLEPYHSGDRKLFYHAMSSPTENWVYTSHLRNQTRFMHNPESSPEVFNTLLTNRPSQSAAEAMDKDGILFFGLMTETSINCWNSANVEYGRYIDTVVRDTVRLQFASGVKIVTNRRGHQELWTMTSRFQKLAAGTMDPNDVNFRVSAGKVSDLLENTKCRMRMSGGSSTYAGGYAGSRPTFGVRSDEDAIIMPSGFEAIAN